MALHLLDSFPLCVFSRLPPRRFVAPTAIACASAPIATPKLGDQAVVRRSGNYKPRIWDHDYVQSLTSVYTGESYTGRAEKLKGNVRMMLAKVLDPLNKLELIDNLQRLGLSYHFEDEIEAILKSIYTIRNSNDNHKREEEDLYVTALEFRLLRQHGFHVPQEVFNSFKDETGKFKESLCKDTKGMLCLYEASYLSIKGENILDDARDFTSRHLAESLEKNMDQYVAMQVSHALELPLHWRMPRLETRWFIENVYEKRKDMNPLLLELAKLDFNMVQAVHQEDLKQMSRWWMHTGLGEKLTFARDRLVENFFWTVGKTMEPQYGYCRRMITKVNVLITTIDDVYDVYGTLDELELFTDAVERWDINAVEHLPYYMKICFLVLYNSTNEMAFDALNCKEQDSYILPYLKKAWADICKAYLVEAKWFHSGYTPTLEEYLNNACVSISAIVILVHIYAFITKPIVKEVYDCVGVHSSIIRCSAMILRLADDLGTSSDEISRGDNPKSIQCYMHETGASEKEAREYIRQLIGETWKKINEDRFANPPFSQTYILAAMNVARMAQCMYLHGDGHGNPDGEMKDRVMSLLVEPIPL